MADDEQQQPGIGQQQQAQQQPGIKQPDEVQLPPQGPTPEGLGGNGGNGEPPFIQQQAPSHATHPCIIPKCAYATNPDYYHFQEAEQAPKLMARTKSLAVSVLHPANHTVRLPEESTKAFAARVHKKAKNNDLQVPCHAYQVPVSDKAELNQTNMPHIEFDPSLINWVQTSIRPPPTLLVTLQLHEKTYSRLNVQRPTKHHPRRPQIGQATNSPKVNTQAVADTGAH